MKRLKEYYDRLIIYNESFYRIKKYNEDEFNNLLNYQNINNSDEFFKKLFNQCFENDYIIIKRHLEILKISK